MHPARETYAGRGRSRRWLAAAFNAPLAGLVFVLEEVQRDFSPGVFSATLVAAAMADVTTRLLLGQLPVFHVSTESIPPLTAVPIAVLVGGLAALLGITFNRALVRSLDAFGSIRTWSPWAVEAVVGAAVSSVGLALPSVLGGADALVERILSGDIALVALVGLFLIRFVLTMVSYGSGAPGGIFAPLLMLRATLGLAVGQSFATLFPGAIVHPESFAVVGMAAYFAAIVRAPLTGVVLMVEMTGNYSLVLPLLAASLAAYGMADYLKDRPIYEALLERDLLSGQENEPLEATLILDLTIAPGSPYDGACLVELGLPEGCIVILLRRGMTEQVPVAATRLTAGDQITLIVAANASAAVPVLRTGAAWRRSGTEAVPGRPLRSCRDRRMAETPPIVNTQDPPSFGHIDRGPAREPGGCRPLASPRLDATADSMGTASWTDWGWPNVGAAKSDAFLCSCGMRFPFF